MADTHPPRSRAALLAVGAAFMITMAGTTLPTAIYASYRQAYGFSSLTITVIFAAYAVGVLCALLLAGSWSDQLGRRRMLFAGLLLSAVAALVFVFSCGLAGLLLGRLLSGLSAGIYTATATVAVIEQTPGAWRRHATLAASAVNMFGLGLGPLLGGLLVDLLPWPLRLPYVVHLALVLLAIGLVWQVPETVQRPARVRLRPQSLSLPKEVRGVFVPAAIAGFAGFVMTGFFTAVASQLLGEVLGHPQSLATGAVVFGLMVFSVLGQTVQGALPDRWRQPAGCVALLLGLAAIALCVLLRSTAVLLLGTALAGCGQGISFRAGLGDITAQSPEGQKAGVAAAFFVVLYVALSVPVIGVGAAVGMVGIERATLIFAAVTAVLVAIALALLLRRQVHAGAAVH